ncbi:MAG: cyclic pyranopterin monophosphate synthase MoaC [Thermoprotei archaeon]|nr:MAG: cyclic pyranopterin monophosphate synthase MoaC [Thermoprotei archaeon]
MVEISEKRDVVRIARAEGFIRLRKETLEKLKRKKIKKGNVIAAAQIAAIQAVKRTWEIIPLCHPIPITGVDAEISIEDDGVRVTVTVTTVAKTGVEMEALTGVSVALLTVWDMVKAYEKNEKGQYPYTVIEKIRVVEKVKHE